MRSKNAVKNPTQNGSDPLVVLGIDPGSLITGYALLEQRGQGAPICVLEYGAIRAKTGDDLMKRLGTICAQLEPRIAMHHPTILAMESSFFSENARTALVLGHARGAVKALASRFHMDFAEYSPRSIKQSVTGSGAADKSRVARMMQLHLKLADLPTPADAADALAVAWTYLTAGITQLKTPNIPNKPVKKSIQTKITSPRGLIANALPPGTDIEALMAQARKRKRK